MECTIFHSGSRTWEAEWNNRDGFSIRPIHAQFCQNTLSEW